MSAFEPRMISVMLGDEESSIVIFKLTKGSVLKAKLDDKWVDAIAPPHDKDSRMKAMVESLIEDLSVAKDHNSNMVMVVKNDLISHVFFKDSEGDTVINPEGGSGIIKLKDADISSGNFSENELQWVVNNIDSLLDTDDSITIEKEF